MGFTGKVLSNQAVAPTVFLLKLKVEGESAFSFKAGQFIIVPLPPEAGTGKEGKPLKAYLSIASAEQAGAELELLIEHRPDGGPVSAWMSARQPGDSFDVQGPLGHFGLLEGQDVGQAFLGSRAGLAPLRSMIHSALAHGGTKPVWLFLGAHGAADLLLDAEWRALDAKEARFHYLPVIQPTAENPFQGKNSDPSDELLKKIAQRTGVRIYLAGFSKDVDPMLAKLKAAGFADTDLKAEKFG
jgi:NAD(P)H-flavin reductase